MSGTLSLPIDGSSNTPRRNALSRFPINGEVAVFENVRLNPQINHYICRFDISFSVIGKIC
jgi:hypothetical protein